MRASLLLCLVAVLVGAVRGDCDACIRKQCYRKHHVQGAEGTPIFVYRETNVLYVLQNEQIMWCDLDTAICSEASKIEHFLSDIAIDQITGDIYGITDQLYDASIYKLGRIHIRMEQSIAYPGTIKKIVFKDNLYYSGSFDNDVGIFFLNNEETSIVSGTQGYYIEQFIIDNKGDIYFQDHTSPKHVIRRLSYGYFNISETWDPSLIMTVDKDDNAVFINPETLAIYQVTDGIQEEIGAFNDSLDGPPIFDRDNNIIYKNRSTANGIYHLKKAKDLRCTIDIIRGNRVITESVTNADSVTETALGSSPDGNEEDDSMSPSTPVAESTSSSAGEGATSPSGAPGRLYHGIGHVHQMTCNCQCHCAHNCF